MPIVAAMVAQLETREVNRWIGIGPAEPRIVPQQRRHVRRGRREPDNQVLDDARPRPNRIVLIPVARAQLVAYALLHPLERRLRRLRGQERGIAPGRASKLAQLQMHIGDVQGRTVGQEPEGHDHADLHGPRHPDRYCLVALNPEDDRDLPARRRRQARIKRRDRPLVGVVDRRRPVEADQGRAVVGAFGDLPDDHLDGG